MTDKPTPMEVLRGILDMPRGDGFSDDDVVAALARDLPATLDSRQKVSDRVTMMITTLGEALGSDRTTPWLTLLADVRRLMGESKSENISMEAEAPVADALAGADVYLMEVDSEIVESSDVGLGLAVVLSQDLAREFEFAVSVTLDGTKALYLDGHRITSAKPMGNQRRLHTFKVSGAAMLEALEVEPDDEDFEVNLDANGSPMVKDDDSRVWHRLPEDPG